MGRVAGKVAFVTGAARGQGRSHAVRLAQEGADVIAVDICHDLDTLEYPLACRAELAETAEMVERTGRRVVTAEVDVRDLAALHEVVERGVGELGRIDIVVANAVTFQKWHEITGEVWADTLDTVATGTWHTLRVSIPHLIAAGGGSMIATASIAGTKGLPYQTPYVAAKHAVVGIARSLATELGPENVRVNTVHPAGVETIQSTVGRRRIGEYAREDPSLGYLYRGSLPVPVLTPSDVSDAVLFLASDESKYVTGTQLMVDAGNSAR
jgi:SDR family mycofactocin-dependent oxidoreductase